jgi:TctA family transporter
MAFDALVAGFLSLFTGDTMLYLCIGVLIGFVVGLLPGLGGPVALAVMIPFTFDMSATAAFAFLLGMNSVTGTTGDITAVLFGVPGESTAAATLLDGFPMTKQGQGGRALGAVLTSSLIGSLFGAAVLAAGIQLIRPLVLTFASPQFFALIVLGLALVSSIGRGAMLKAAIAALGGLLLAMVGLDTATGTPRFTMGFLSLWDGPGLVPVSIGLFAIPELLDVVLRGTSIAGGDSPSSPRVSGMLEGVKDTFKHIGLTLRCSAIGTFVGILPGLGSSVGQWAAYAHAVQSSPRYDDEGNERFGNGAIEGVLGPGAANNSKEGGGLIPTIAFGVPGSLTASILLGAFIIHGLNPGRELLTTHLDLTMSFVSIIVIANILAVAIALLSIRPIIRLTRARLGFIIPPIVLFVFFGSYASNNQMSGVVVMLVSGVLGVLMSYLGWPRPPLILGLVLGGLAEKYYTISVSRYGHEWLTFPSVLTIFGIALVALAYPFVNDALRARRSGYGDEARAAPGGGPHEVGE